MGLATNAGLEPLHGVSPGGVLELRSDATTAVATPPQVTLLSGLDADL